MSPSIAIAQQSHPAASANAYGTYVHVDNTIVSQKSAAVGVACSLDPVVKEEDVAGVDVAGLASVGAVATTAERLNWAAGPVARATSAVENIELLGGLVGATAVKAVSVTRKRDGEFKVYAAGTHFADLVVAGIPIDIDIPPNTELDIPLVGHVKINEQAHFIGANRARHRTTMLRVVVTLPILFDVGTEIVVGNAQTNMSNVTAIVGGVAYSTSVHLGDLSILDPSFRQGMSCGGTNGRWLNNGGVLAELPGVLGSATARNWANGNATPTGAVATTVATIEDADVLNGLVTADVIYGRARVEKDGSTLRRGVNASKFLSLSIAGFPEITDGVPFNTHLDILGVGDLWIKRVVRWPGAIQVRMLELTVLDGTVLPIGAVVRVGVAQAKVLGV